MKKSLYFLIVALIFSCSACRYEEGPGISFRKPETRIQGYWQLQKVYKNGEQVVETEDIARSIGAYYSFFFDGYLTVTVNDNGTMRESPTGRWLFQNGEKDLLIEFVLIDNHYEYVAKVNKLSYNELRYEYKDANGDTWKLVMFKQTYW